MSDNFTKKELIYQIAKELDVTQKEARSVVENTLSTITQSLADGKPVVLSGLGTFWIHHQNERTGAHPRTGKITWFPAKLKPRFKPGKNLAETINNFQPMSEKRKLQRRNFIYDIQIWNRSVEVNLDSESHVLGELADITVEGVMIVSDNPIEEDTVYELRVMLPDNINNQEFIDFKARSIRCNKTIHESIYTTGFIITDIDSANHTIIETLIEEYAV